MMTLLLALTLGCRTKVQVSLDDTGVDTSVDSAACVPTGEVCDGVDNDCDGLVDDADPDRTGPYTWFVDNDGDGYGDVAFSDLACEQPVGFVADSTDCNDANSSVNPGAPEVCDSGIDDDCDGLIDGQDDSLEGASTWYTDADSDGYGDASASQVACNQPDGAVSNSTDCDDSSSSVHPGALEVCDSGIDDDCDGLVDGQDPSLSGASAWYTDADLDGYGDASTTQYACNAPAGTVSNGTDCDDSSSSVNPGAPEVCDHGIDDDCDGLIDGQDDSLTGASTWYTDADSDGYGDASSTQYACNEPSGAVSNSTDCDDSSSSVNPGAPEVCDSGIDDDCDDLVDGQDSSLTDGVTWYQDADGDGYGDPATTNYACSSPTGYVSNASDCDDTDASVGRCSGVEDDGSVCSGRWGADDGQVPTYTGTCDTTAGFSSYGGHCYYAVNTSISGWDDARATCALAGGSLAVTTDAAESAYVYSIAGRTYLGGCDDDVEGTWTWVNGEPWSYEDWGSGEPNDMGTVEECLETEAHWNDIRCPDNSYGQRYVCEFE